MINFFNSVTYNENIKFKLITGPGCCLKEKDLAMRDMIEYQKLNGVFLGLNCFLNDLIGTTNHNFDLKNSLISSCTCGLNPLEEITESLMANPTLQAAVNVKAVVPPPDVDQLKQDAALAVLEVLAVTMQDIKTNYPDDLALFQVTFDAISRLIASVPVFSADEMLRIQQLPDELGQLMVEADMTKDYRLQFRADVSGAYQGIMDQVTTDIQAVSNAITGLTFEEEVTASVGARVDALYKYFSNLNILGLEDVFLSYEEAADAVCLFLSIIRSMSNLTTEQQTTVSNSLNSLMNSRLTSQGNGYSMSNVFGELYSYYLSGQISAANAILTVTQVNNAIKTEANVFIDIPGFTALADFKAAMIRVADNNGRSSIDSSKYLYFDNNNEGVDISFLFLQNMVTATSGTGGVLNSLSESQKNTNATSYVRFNSLWSVIQETTKEDLANLQLSLQALSTYNTVLDTLLLQAYGFQMQEFPLPAAVAFVLLDHYMPKEVTYLETLTSTLYYNNLGSKIGTSVLEGIINFVNAASYFNFASYAGKQPVIGVAGFPGDIDKAKQKVINEKEKAIAFLVECQTTQNIISQQITAVQDDKVLTNDQKNNLIRELNNHRDSLNEVAGCLASVWVLLSQLTIVATTDSQNAAIEGMYNVKGPTNWQPLLENLETAIVTGIVGSPLVSGLFSTQAVVQSNQQSFADDGQNNQLDLQMHLTTMQQEWTVVATSLQILNQIYLSLARSILG